MIVADDRVAKFIAKRLDYTPVAPWTVMGIERDGKIIAGVLFNCFEGANVHFSAVGHGWTPGFMRAVGGYVFGTLGCLRMTATTEQPDVVRLAEKLGGKVEGMMRDHFGAGRDGTIVGVLAREWKFR